MTRTTTLRKRILAGALAAGMLTMVAAAPVASAQPGPGSKPQCAGGKFPGGNGNPHCPQNR